MGINDTSPSLRKEILNGMRDNAGKEFYEAWAKNPDGMEMFRVWLKSAMTKKDPSSGKKENEETLMPLLNVGALLYFIPFFEWNLFFDHESQCLHIPLYRCGICGTNIELMICMALQVIDRLPLGLEELRTSRIGKVIKSIVTDPPTNGEHMFHTFSNQSIPSFPPTFPSCAFGNNMDKQKSTPLGGKTTQSKS